MENNREKYVKLSIAGKWQALARQIIIDNPGITRSKFVEIAAPLMPRHICRNPEGKKTGPVSLALKAIGALSSEGAIYESDGKLFSVRRSIPDGPSRRILEFASTNKTVESKNLSDIGNFCRLASQLCKRGLLERVSKGVYKKAEATNEPT